MCLPLASSCLSFSPYINKSLDWYMWPTMYRINIKGGLLMALLWRECLFSRQLVQLQVVHCKYTPHCAHVKHYTHTHTSFDNQYYFNWSWKMFDCWMFDASCNRLPSVTFSLKIFRECRCEEKSWYCKFHGNANDLFGSL